MKQSDVLASLRLSRPDLFDLDPKQGEDLLTVEIKRLDDLLSTFKRLRRSYSMKRRYNETEAKRIVAQAIAAAPVVVAPPVPPAPPEPLPPPRNKFEADIDAFFAEHFPPGGREEESPDPREDELADDYVAYMDSLEQDPSAEG